MILLKLFYVFFKIGLFSFGGGYAILALLQGEVVEKLKWIDISDFTEIVAISQITPGPIAINLATHVGYKMGGTLGSTLATLGVVAPSIIVISIIGIFLKKFSKSAVIQRSLKALKVVVIGLILGAALVLCTPDNFIDTKSYIIFFTVLILGFFIKNISTISLIVISGGLGFIFYYIF